MTPPADRQSWVPRAAAALFGFCVYLGHGGGVTLWPTHLDWLIPNSDWAFHYAGWSMFRHAPWILWPLGEIPDLQFPAGSTIGFNDGIPWLALPLKLLSPLLPADFQYIGMWLALCFTLQGWFGVRLAQTVAPRCSNVGAALAGGLFVCSPILIVRLVHEALCGHFLLLWAIALALRPSRRFPRAAPLGLVALASGIHPYLAVMVAPLCVAALFRARAAGHLRRRSSTIALAAGGFALFVAISGWLGYFGGGGQLSDAAGRGFGECATDLLAPLNPGEYTWFLPSRPPRTDLLWEDPGYVGLGGLILLAGGLGLLVAGRLRREPPLPWRKATPLLVATGLMAIYAASPRIAVHGVVLVDLTPLYEPFALATGAFRMAGRFIWPATYVLLAGGVAVWARRRLRVAPWLFAVALAAQIGDLRTLMWQSPFTKSHPRAGAFAREWDLAAGAYRHLALFPPRCTDSSWVCCKTARKLHWLDVLLVDLAVREGLTLNGGGTSRARRSLFEPYCAELERKVLGGKLDADTIYWIADDRAAEVRAANPGATCGMLDGALACVAPEARGPFRDHLQSKKPK